MTTPTTRPATGTDAEPNAFALLGLSMAQLLSAPCIAIGLFALWRSLRQRRKAGRVIGSG